MFSEGDEEGSHGLYREQPGGASEISSYLHIPSLYLILPGTIHRLQLPFVHPGALALRYGMCTA